MSALTSLVVAVALAVGAALAPGSLAALPAADGASAAPSGPAPVTVIGLTDSSGERTDVAVDGIEAVAQDSAAPALARVAARFLPASSAAVAARAAEVPDPAAGIAVLTEPVATPEFMVAGVTWAAGDRLPDGARVFLRVLEGAHWSDWQDLEVEDPAGRGTPGTEAFVTGGAGAVQVQVTGDAAALPASLGLTLVPATPSDVTTTITQTPAQTPLQPAADPTADVATVALVPQPEGPAVVPASYAVRTPAAASATASLPAAVARPAITSRASWGADESLATWAPSAATLRAVVIHHTAGTNSYTASQSPSIVRGIFYYHAVTRDWGDIGYNFLVDKYGQVFEGRRGSLTAAATTMTVGAHASSFNTGTMGLSAMGDYTQVNAPQVILDRMADLIAWRFSAAGINPATSSGLVSPGTAYRAAGQSLPRVFAHRDVGSTTCPGNDIYGRLPGVRDAVAARLAGAAAAPAPAPAVNTAASPKGNLESVWAVPGGVRVTGWSFDPETSDPIYLWVTVDGAGGHVLADKERADVGAAFPAAGSRHGFDDVRAVGAGTHEVCVTASNVGQGAHTPFGCRTVTVRSGSPVGQVAYVRPATGAVQLEGWAVDPDTTAPVYIWLTVDGVGRHLYANLAAPAAAAAHPGYGSTHGFRDELALAPGTHEICLAASNVDAGSHTSLGCSTLRVLADPNPLGRLARLEAVPGGVAVEGWTLDPDTTAPVYVWATLNGAGRYVYADRTRDDIAGEYPGYGARHGFGGTIAAAPGSYRVCLTTSNVGAGGHLELGCRDVVVRAGSPIGHVDSVVGTAGGVALTGWALDPDVTGSLYLYVTIDGQPAFVHANRTRADIAAAFPGYGGAHGFAATLPASPGAHQVCVAATNTGSGSHVSFGCWNTTATS